MGHFHPRPVLQRRALLILGATLLFSYAYFYNPGGWNEDSRLDMTRAIVEEHRLAIDTYAFNTGDKSFFRGHYYCDKAPGMSFAAAGVYAVLHFIDPRLFMPEPGAVLRYVAALFCVGFPTALAGACLFWIALQLGASSPGALLAAVTYGLGTPIWSYSTVVWGHATVAALYIFALAILIALGRRRSSRSDFWLSLALGLLLGWSVAVEYPSGIPAILFSIALGCVIWERRRERLLPCASGLLLGAAACVLLLMWYHNAVFGSPFSIGYSHESLPEFQTAMGVGFQGLTHPRYDALRKLLIGRERGLLVLSPVLVFALPGWWYWKRHGQPFWLIAPAVLIPLYYWLLNASFIVWTAGTCYGPRYMGGAFGLMCLPLATVWTRARRLRSLLFILGAFGVFAGLVGAFGGAIVPSEQTFPLRDRLRLFHAGHFPAPPVANVGTVLGLHGYWSLLPLFVFWCAAVVVWRYTLKRRPAEQSSEPVAETTLAS